MSQRGPRHLLPQLLEAQNHRCCYCGCCLLLNARSKHKNDNATLEHVVPKHKFLVRTHVHSNREQREYDPSHGEWSNCVAACSDCNTLRNNLDAYIFAENKLWRLENRGLLKLLHLLNGYKISGTNRTLQRMAKYCGGSCKDV